jgi:hypothetical protein
VPDRGIRRETDPDGQAGIEPPPTFPFLESQCQRAISGANFNSARTLPPFARTVLRPAWAAYIGGQFRPVKRLFTQFSAFLKPRFCKLFRDPCGSLIAVFARANSGLYRPPSRLSLAHFRSSVRYRTVPRGGAKWPLFGCRSTPISRRASFLFSRTSRPSLTRRRVRPIWGSSNRVQGLSLLSSRSVRCRCDARAGYMTSLPTPCKPPSFRFDLRPLPALLVASSVFGSWTERFNRRPQDFSTARSAPRDRAR